MEEITKLENITGVQFSKSLGEEEETLNVTDGRKSPGVTPSSVRNGATWPGWKLRLFAEIADYLGLTHGSQVSPKGLILTLTGSKCLTTFAEKVFIHVVEKVRLESKTYSETYQNQYGYKPKKEEIEVESLNCVIRFKGELLSSDSSPVIIGSPSMPFSSSDSTSNVMETVITIAKPEKEEKPPLANVPLFSDYVDEQDSIVPSQDNQQVLLEPDIALKDNKIYYVEGVAYMNGKPLPKSKFDPPSISSPKNPEAATTSNKGKPKKLPVSVSRNNYA